MVTRVAIPSPFPWSPGHVIQEIEYLAQIQLLTGRPSKIYLPVIEGPVSTPFFNIYESLLSTYSIELIRGANSIQEFFASDLDIAVESISLSHHVILPASHGNTQHLKALDTQSVYAQLSNNNLKPYHSSTKLLITNMNSYSCNYYSLPPLKPLIKPLDDLTMISRVIPEINDGRKIVILNIREHCANANSPLGFNDYLPLMKYLLSAGYLVIDASHENKACAEELLRIGVIPYWKIPEKSFQLDIELFSKAAFYIGGGGISHLAYTFKIPSLWVGSLFPIPLPLSQGFQLPCRLRDRNTLKLVSTDEAFSIFYNTRNPWDFGYDSWSKAWGFNLNPFNCFDEITSQYVVENPHPLDLVNAFLKLQDLTMSNKYLNAYFFQNCTDLNTRPFYCAPVAGDFQES